MKFNKIARAVILSGTIASLTACSTAEDSESTSSGSAKKVTTSLKMTASSLGSAVAYKPTIFDLIINRAMAFVPESITDSNGTAVTLSNAWIVIEEIEFKKLETADESELENESESEFKGPYFVDLLSTSPDALGTAQIPAEGYRRVKFKLHKAEDDATGIPAELEGHSIYLAGVVGGNAFTFQTSEEAEFEIAGANAVTPSSASDLLVQFQLANLVKEIDLSGLPDGAAISKDNRYAGSNLCPSIDASAADVYTCFNKGMRRHSDFGSDHNRDGRLEDDEDHVGHDDDYDHEGSDDESEDD